MNAKVTDAPGSLPASVAFPTGGSANDLLIAAVIGASQWPNLRQNNGDVDLTNTLRNANLASVWLNVFWDILSAGDISNGTVEGDTNVNNQDPLIFGLYSGAVSFAVRESVEAAAGGDNHINFAGFTPAAGSLGAFMMVWVGGGSSNACPTTLTGWNVRAANLRTDAPDNDLRWYTVSLFDKFDYAGGAIAVPGFDASNFSIKAGGFIGEFLPT